MDAVKYLEERKRMCGSYTNMCDGCGFGKAPKCNNTEDYNPEKAVAIVEKWSKEHPVKTRQSVLLESYPNAKKGSNGILMASPCYFDENVKNRCKQYDTCADCQKEYWLAEVE